ncbi:MAG: N-6 DNA methylase [candidate division Zixibacteria bacterium]
MAGWISQEINRIITTGGFPFEEASIETSLPGKKASLFPDIVVWENRQTEDAFAFIELKKPGLKENIKKLPEKANRLGVSYCLTWDFMTATLHKIENKQLKPKVSFKAFIFSDIENWKRKDVRIKITTFLCDLLETLKELKEKGTAYTFIPEKFYFINFLREAVDRLAPILSVKIQKSAARRKFRMELDAWARKQAIASSLDADFFENIAQHWAYSLVTRILFYLTIKRHFSELPDIITTGKPVENIQKSLRESFVKAKAIDWYAVFEESIFDSQEIPKDGTSVIEILLSRLSYFNFGKLREDVIGEIFEQLIPNKQRHRLGQYFTREDLVDLIIGFVCETPEEHYCDPTCGSGTFLNRLYSRIKYLSSHKRKHSQILSQIWGIDVSPFPAQLATINLFKQEISNFSNFPRVINSDFFEIYPGKIFEFPPPKAEPNIFRKIAIETPNFKGMVGNFPYIRQELIEKSNPGYKSSLINVIAQGWLWEYPEAFEIKANNSEFQAVSENSQKAKNNYIMENIEKKRIGLKLSGQSDIYAYLFFHAGRFLENGGRMGFITSNSWLDVAYGNELKKFMLNNFKIVAIVGSWIEPWFEDASINTIFVILERCESKEKRDQNEVRFVKLKKRLDELIPFNDLILDEFNRWQHIDSLVSKIGSAGKRLAKTNKKASFNQFGPVGCYEDDDFQIRLIKQGKLIQEKSLSVSIEKWGKFLRAPEIYFDIIEKCKDILVPLSSIIDIRRGYTTGINDFFYLAPTSDKAKNKERLVVTTKNWIGEIEEEYLKLVIKSPKEAKGLVVDPAALKFRLFVCNESKAQLKNKGKIGALRYIEWGEKQRTKNGILWPQVPSVKARKNWWSIEDREPGSILVQMINNERFTAYINESLVCVDHNLFELFPQPGDIEFISAFLNSYISALNREVISRINLGDGATKTEGIDWQNEIFVVNPKEVNKNLKSAVIDNFRKLKRRESSSVFTEVKKSDRSNADSSILELLGLDCKSYQSRLYEGLLSMVDERLSLPKLRKRQKKLKETTSNEQIKEIIENEILHDGVRQFPDSFLPGSYGKKSRQIATTGKPLKVGEYFFGKYGIKDDDGEHIYDANGIDEAKFVVYSYKPEELIIELPSNSKAIGQAVQKYDVYIDNLQERILTRVLAATADFTRAEIITAEILLDYNIPVISRQL